MKAERCHACGAKFMAPIGNRMLPVAMAYTIDAPRRSRRLPVAVLSLLVVAGGLLLAYRYYGHLLFPTLQAMAAARTSPTPQSDAPRAMPIEGALPVHAAAVQPAREEAPTTMPAKEAPKTTGAKQTPKVAAAAVRPADGRAAPRLNRAVVLPAHAPANAPAATPEGDASAKQASAVVEVSSWPQIPAMHTRVTHTKAFSNDASLPVASVVARPPTGSSGCSEPAAAFGLCGSNEKGEGK